jgi:hypothetical protein
LPLSSGPGAKQNLFRQQLFEDSRSVIARIHLVVNPGNSAFLIDQEAYPLSIGGLDVTAGTVGQSDGAGCVTQKRKPEVVFPGKRGILFDLVKAHAYHRDIVLVKVALMVAEPAAFNRSARSVGFRVKPQQHPPPPQARKRKLLAFVSRQSEIRRRVSNFQHLFFLA